MDRANVDTDQIIPKQFLKRIERTGFGQYLFFDWRFREDGSEIPGFELNQPQVCDATILLARRNFGCGSSREHAVWAIADYGIRVVIAPSFADIFYNNCFKNAVLPVKFDEHTIEQLFQRAAVNLPYRLSVDLEQCSVKDQHGLQLKFSIDEFRRHCLLHGLDDISLTMQHEEKIVAYESAHGIS